MRERRDTILIVDDIEMDRAVLRDLLEGDYNLLEAESGVQAMLLLEEYHATIAVALLKMEIAMDNGHLVLEEIRSRGFLNEVPVVTIVTERSTENEAYAFELGASDIVIKPFEPHVVSGRLQNIAGLYYYRRHMGDLVEEQAQNLRESNEVLTDALSSVIEYRSMESGQHVLRIRMFTKILLRNVAKSCPEYDLDERKIGVISQAAAMHDIGKIAIPDSILNKPGKLTDEEFEIMKTHAVKGSELLETIAGLGNQEYLGYAYRICRYHHERWDGGGYPDGLKGEGIPICAQVAGIADCYDALTTDRVYKKAYTHEKAVNTILNGECGAFSPKLLECFKNVRGQFQAMALEYADGRASGIKFPEETILTNQSYGLNTPQLAQTKYFLLLRYLGCTVIEADVDNDIYHMVYAPDRDFDVLRTGGTFSEALNEFYRTCVYPDDRGPAEENMKGYLDRFFREGLLKKSREYRVFRKSLGAYHWYRCTTLRVDTENPHRHRAILIWQDIGADRAAVLDSLHRNGQADDMCQSIPGGIFLCRNDAELTILHKGAGFAGMFGYTETELWERFHGSFLRMVCQEDRKALQDNLFRQLFHGNLVECEYRVRCQNGTDMWVLGKCKMVEEDGEEHFYCVLVDMTRTRQNQEELRLSLERHQIIMDQTNDIIFEWDIMHDKVTYSPNWEKKFGYSPLSDKYQALIGIASHIHPDDTKNLRELMTQVRGGLPYAETEYRVAKSDGHYIWCRVRATAQIDADGKPIKAVGVIVDIDAEKRAAAKLQEKAEQDVLTGLYNKSAARARVERYLGNSAPQDVSAMLILDVDNFKLVNDRYGHMFGDAVLTHLAEQLKGLSHGGDVISRIGGDEFLVFLPLIPSREMAVEQAQNFISALRNAVHDVPETCELSCSIGVAFTPEHGTAFRNLFQRADLALYQAKKAGKNCLRVYESGDMDQLFSGDARHDDLHSALGARIDSDDENAIDEMGLMQYAFQRLYQSGDVDEAVHAVLKLAGERFNVSRAYIFENTEDDLYCRNTFEWCNKGITPQKSQLLMVSYEDDLGGTYQQNFNEDGIFYCPDIAQLPEEQYEVLAPQGIKSMLQCAILDQGAFKGYVGFDEDSGKRLWTQEQINALTLISELLSVFLLKKRAQDRTAATAASLRLLLDNQNAWIYLIDPETHELFYINQKTKLIAPDAEVGMCCHQAFFHRDTPCEQCPARGIRGKLNCTMEIYNPVLKVWSEADGSLVKWGDKDACLLTCRDITQFKEKKGEA